MFAFSLNFVGIVTFALLVVFSFAGVSTSLLVDIDNVNWYLTGDILKCLLG